MGAVGRIGCVDGQPGTVTEFDLAARCAMLEIPDLSRYERIVVTFSGGKDSLAQLLFLLEIGVPRDRIELHHHEVDGREGSDLFDWPVTRAYCEAVARTLDLPIFFSWRVGGLEGEMLRRDAATAAVMFERIDHSFGRAGGKSKNRTTRWQYPQIGADLTTRWCSAYAKIMVLDALIANEPRFLGTATLVVTGERAEESPARRKYSPFKPHRTDPRSSPAYDAAARRHPPLRVVDHWLPVHGWSEAEVWETIRRWGVVPHPAYFLGLSRCSCQYCIFSSPHQLATMRLIDPERFGRHASYETLFGKTIHRSLTIEARANKGTPYAAATPQAVRVAMSRSYDGPVIVDPAEWVLPPGAFGEDKAGPT